MAKMKMTLRMKDVKAVENAIIKYGTIEKVHEWINDLILKAETDKRITKEQFQFLVYFRMCVKTYKQWMNEEIESF